MLSIPGMKSVYRSMFRVDDPKLKRSLFGLEFPNPVGLAAGFDKDGKFYDTMQYLGFGFIEIGTVTPKPQEGNPKPRLFRLPADEGLINRMGFNNEGLEAMVTRLKNRKDQHLIIGGNIGKNKVTPNEEAVKDYEICFEQLHPLVDYFVVNVSSPNTPNLRALQEKEPLTNLLNHLRKLNLQKEKQKPILLKIAPDLNTGQLDDIIQIIQDTKTDGVIAANTTIERNVMTSDQSVKSLKTSDHELEQIGNGGLSGKPVRYRSTEVIRYLSEKSGKAFPIIAVGGIDSAEAAIEKIQAGADLVQIYTGLIYQGPALIKKINRGILKSLK